MKILFAGTPDFAARSLRALLDDPAQSVCAVLTQPDRPRGRGRKLMAGPVKALAEEAGLPVLQPETLRDNAILGELAAFEPDVMVVVAYGRILPDALIAMPRFGTINVHASLLPRWRGAAPIQRSIMAGDAESGVTIMEVVPELDAGPMIRKVACPIDDDTNSETLHDTLAALGARALCEALGEVGPEGFVSEAQDPALVTYAHKITADDRPLDFARSARELQRQLRGLAPRPGATATIEGHPVQVLAARVSAGDGDGSAAPGTVLSRPKGADGALVVACGSDALAITELKPEGKRAMSASAFANGYLERG